MITLPMLYPGDFLMARMMLQAIKQRVEKSDDRDQIAEQVVEEYSLQV
jgi:hypothetical protein